MANGESYRIYFRKPSGIVGRYDFDAADDHAALTLAEMFGEACSDECSSFELWHHTRRVAPERSATVRRLLSADDINIAMQTLLIEYEEAIQRSDWAIAHSKRLSERLDALRAAPETIIRLAAKVGERNE